MYLLDSNVVIDLMDQREAVLRRAEAAPPGSLFLSSVVWYELTYGAFNSRRVTENLDRLHELSFPMVVFDGADAIEAARLRARLKRDGNLIGAYDLLIAGQALARDLTLVTHNIGEFARVSGLRIENWAG